MNFLFLLPGAFFAPVIHEFVKARVSAALGDQTPKKNGFITWNPFKFFEPIGFFMMMYFQVGWGQPVTTSPFYYKDKRKGIALTYTAPIVANLLVGIAAITLLSILRGSLHYWAIDYGVSAATAMSAAVRNELNWSAVMQLNQGAPPVFFIVLGLCQAIFLFARLNIGFALFNLIPIFPMAMNKLLHLFVSPETSMRLNHYEKPLQILLFLMLFFGVIQQLIFPIREIIIRAVTF